MVLFLYNINNKQKLILSCFILTLSLLAITLVNAGSVSAATLNVSGTCPLDDAITSVNNSADESTCTSIGVYGNNDTINIPSGTQTLTSNLPSITEPVTIAGAGMNQTTIDGDGQWNTFIANNVDLTVSDLKITGFYYIVLNVTNANATINNVEIDGQDAGATTNVVDIFSSTSDNYDVNVSNLYVHNINMANDVTAFLVTQSGGGTMNANLDKITIADIHTAGTAHVTAGFNMVASTASTGTVNSKITNTTIYDITGDDLVAPFGSFGIAEGGVATINTEIRNITITGTRGFTGTGMFAGVKSAAFYSAGAAIEVGDEANVIVSVTNSLLADNLNDGISSNCSLADFTDAFDGLGTDVNTSIISNGYNISDDNSCASFNEVGDKQNVPNIISTLGPLQNNGGNVPTRALLPGSPAIGAGSAVLGITTDARGVARTNGWDVGAYQSNLGVSTSGEEDGDSGSGTGTDGNSSGGVGVPNTGVQRLWWLGSRP